MISTQNPLYYHPLRMQTTRPFLRKMAGNFSRRPGLLFNSEFQKIYNDILSIYNNEIVKLQFEQRPKGTDRFVEEINAISGYIKFFNNGKNIFSLSPGLTELLKHTDVGEVVLSQIPFVFNHFYLSFGQQTDLEIYPGFHVDGAYIHTLHENILDIYVTTTHKDLQQNLHLPWPLIPEQHYYLPIDRMGNKTVAESCQEAFFEEIKSLDKNVEIPDEDIALANSMGISLRNAHPINKETRKNLKRAGFPVFRDALNLIINGICYLGYHKREVVTRHMESVPPEILQKIETEQKRKKKRAYQKELEYLGYYPINFCGDSIASENIGVKTGKEMPSHWRRGHWRNQPYGEGRVERHLRWIMPTIVRADKGHPESGHTYRVDSQESDNFTD